MVKTRRVIPWKVLRYLSLTPIFQRLFILSKTTTTDMIWHNEKRVKDSILKHHFDFEVSKSFYNIHKSLELWNIRINNFIPLGILKLVTTDGRNLIPIQFFSMDMLERALHVYIFILFEP